MDLRIETDLDTLITRRRPKNYNQTVQKMFLAVGIFSFITGLAIAIPFSGILRGIGVLFAVMGAGATAFSFFVVKLNVKAQARASEKRNGKIVYEIDDTVFKHSVEMPDGRANSKTSQLSSLTKAKEDETAFTLYFTTFYFLTLPKAAFVKGAPAELSAKLKELLGDKFKPNT
jgi:hypothetical protein